MVGHHTCWAVGDTRVWNLNTEDPVWLSLVGLVKNESISVSLTPDLVSICPWLKTIRCQLICLKAALVSAQPSTRVPLVEEQRWHGTRGLCLGVICPNSFRLLSSTDREAIVLTTTKAMSKCYGPQKKRSRKGRPHTKKKKKERKISFCWSHPVHACIFSDLIKWPAEMCYHLPLVFTCFSNVSCDHFCYQFSLWHSPLIWSHCKSQWCIHFLSAQLKKGTISLLFVYILKDNLNSQNNWIATYFKYK